MKNIFTIIIILLSFSASQLTGQVCVPDTLLTKPGIYPDSAAGIPPATEGQLYNLIITARAPKDTVVLILGNPQNVVVDSIVLTKINNAPAWMTYACEPISCGFWADSIRCALFSGTPPAGSAGTYTMDLITTSYGKLQGIPQQLPPQTDTSFGFYTLVVNPGTGFKSLINEENKLVASPNPAINEVSINFLSQTTLFGSLMISGISGRIYWAEERILQQGVNQIIISTEHWPAGMYFIEMNSGNSRSVSKLLVIK